VFILLFSIYSLAVAVLVVVTWGNGGSWCRGNEESRRWQCRVEGGLLLFYFFKSSPPVFVPLCSCLLFFFLFRFCYLSPCLSFFCYHSPFISFFLFPSGSFFFFFSVRSLLSLCFFFFCFSFSVLSLHSPSFLFSSSKSPSPSFFSCFHINLCSSLKLSPTSFSLFCSPLKNSPCSYLSLCQKSPPLICHLLLSFSKIFAPFLSCNLPLYL